MALRDERRWIGPVPVRLCDPLDRPAAATIIFYHGLGASIAGQTTELHSLARAGFRVVGVDAVGHGLRRWADFEARFSPERRRASLVEVLDESLDELGGLVRGLIAEGLTDGERLGVGGISMGGFICYGAPLVEPRIRVLTPILASPCWPRGADHDPSHRAEAFPPSALLSQNAALDENVPAIEARRFHALLEPLYASHPERLEHIEHADCGHFMPADAWARLWARVVAWYLRFL